MKADMQDLVAFLTVIRAGGFREGARTGTQSASSLSEAVRRLETRLDVRLLNRTTRSIAPTEAGARLAERLTPILGEVDSALDSINSFRNTPTGTLRLNVPANVARLVLPAIVTPFLKTYPDITLEIIVEDSFVDVLAAGCDAGIRYDESLEQDMIALPIGPRTQRFATAAAPSYLATNPTPQHPQDLLSHACLTGRFSSGTTPHWEFEKNGDIIKIKPPARLITRPAATLDLAVSAALDGLGIIHLFEDWLKPHLDSGALVPLLKPWWQSFSGPYFYYPGRRHLPSPLRAFVDFIKTH